MIKKNILGLLFLLSALCLFNSCEDDPYYDDYGWATDALCNNTWVDFYTNNKGYECEQRLDFYNDHTGEDFTIIYYPFRYLLCIVPATVRKKNNIMCFIIH